MSKRNDRALEWAGGATGGAHVPVGERMKPSLEIRDPAQAQYISDATAHVTAVENHFVHLYEDATSLSEVVADYLTAGLNVGQAAVAFITEPHRRALFDLLGTRGVDV